MADNLYDHIVGEVEQKLTIHQFMASLAEVDRGIITATQAGAMFSFVGAGAQTEITTLLANLQAASITRERIHDVLFLAEVKLAPYDTKTFVDTQLGI